MMETVKPGSVSIYEIMAHLFAVIAQEVEGKFGVEGEATIRTAVHKFGQERGERIAAAAAADGKANTADNYLPYYDMERSELFTSESSGDALELHQNFSQCVFADTWSKLNLQKYGLLYCEEIDPAIASAFNPDLKCVHDKYLLKGDNCCNFKFVIESEKKK
jgi:hypothetical protein